MFLPGASSQIAVRFCSWLPKVSIIFPQILRRLSQRLLCRIRQKFLSRHVLYRLFHILRKDPSIRRANCTVSLSGFAHTSSKSLKYTSLFRLQVFKFGQFAPRWAPFSVRYSKLKTISFIPLKISINFKKTHKRTFVSNYDNNPFPAKTIN